MSTALASVIACPAAAQSDEPVLDLPPVVQPSGACAPPKLFRATVREISPGVAAADRRAQPREIWRQGALFLRSVEQSMPPSGDRRTIIIAEPDIWMLSDATRTAQHATDPGPVLEVRAPILPVGPGIPAELRELEFGCEIAFIAKYAPAPSQSLKWGRDDAALHTYQAGDHAIALLVMARRQTPLMISYLRQGKPVFVLRYDDYRQGMDERPQLFQPPAGYKIVEGPAKARPLD